MSERLACHMPPMRLFETVDEFNDWRDNHRPGLCDPETCHWCAHGLPREVPQATLWWGEIEYPQARHVR